LSIVRTLFRVIVIVTIGIKVNTLTNRLVVTSYNKNPQKTENIGVEKEVKEIPW